MKFVKKLRKKELKEEKMKTRFDPVRNQEGLMTMRSCQRDFELIKSFPLSFQVDKTLDTDVDLSSMTTLNDAFPTG